MAFVGRICWLVSLACAFVANAGAAETLRILCWSEYIPASVVDGFAKENGAKVQLETYASNEEMLAKLLSRRGTYDLVQPSGFYVERLARAGELAPLDFSRIPNARHLNPAYRRLPFDPEGKYSVPWLSGMVGIVYNTERDHEPIASWEDVFNGRHAGRIVVVDDDREMVAWALASLDRPITDVSADALKAVEPVLRRWLPQVARFDSDQPHAALVEGLADIGIVWSGEAALVLRSAPGKFRFVQPAKGAHRFVDSLAIPKGAPNQRLAEAFIDYCLRPEISVQISRAYPYTNPNAAARRLLTPEERENPASYPPGIERLPMLRNEGNDAKAVSEFVKRIRAEVRR